MGTQCYTGQRIRAPKSRIIDLCCALLCRWNWLCLLNTEQIKFVEILIDSLTKGAANYLLLKLFNDNKNYTCLLFLLARARHEWAFWLSNVFFYFGFLACFESLLFSHNYKLPVSLIRLHCHPPFCTVLEHTQPAASYCSARSPWWRAVLWLQLELVHHRPGGWWPSVMELACPAEWGRSFLSGVMAGYSSSLGGLHTGIYSLWSFQLLKIGYFE